MKTVYVGEIDHECSNSLTKPNNYFVDWISTQESKRLHRYSSRFGTFKEANDFRNDLISDLK